VCPFREALSNAFVSGNCGKGECAGTVTVNRKCYWAAEVNFFLFGAVRRACADYIGAPHPEGFDEHPYLEGSRAATYAWRSGMYFWRFATDAFVEERRRDYGVGASGRVAWVNAGWYNDFTRATTASTQSSRLSKCKPCKKAKRTKTGGFQGYFGGSWNRVHF